MKKTTAYDAFQDPKIHKEVQQASAKTSDLIVEKHSIGEEE
jgi:hypothetical protein